MKKRLVSIGIIFIIIMSNSLEVFAWLAQKDTYIACNIINACISDFLRVTAFCIAIFYITMVIKYTKYSKKSTKEKVRKILIWLIITIIEIAILLLGTRWVTQVGMEEYLYPTGERYQLNQLDGYISNSIRIAALFSIIFYILKAIAYWVQSKEKIRQKLVKLSKWQMITIIISVALLLIATKW